jgi:hypothetical protein
MKNPYPEAAGDGRECAAHDCYDEPSKSPGKLSSKIRRDFLPAGKDFTNSSSNFLPAGIPFLEVPKRGWHGHSCLCAWHAKHLPGHRRECLCHWRPFVLSRPEEELTLGFHNMIIPFDELKVWWGAQKFWHHIALGEGSWPRLQIMS